MHRKFSPRLAFGACRSLIRRSIRYCPMHRYYPRTLVHPRKRGIAFATQREIVPVHTESDHRAIINRSLGSSARHVLPPLHRTLPTATKATRTRAASPTGTHVVHLRPVHVAAHGAHLPYRAGTTPTAGRRRRRRGRGHRNGHGHGNVLITSALREMPEQLTSPRRGFFASRRRRVRGSSRRGW